MQKIDLAFEHFPLPAKANLLIQDCKEAGDEICAHGGDYGGIPNFEPADGKISWHLLSSVERQVLPERTLVFCEWGSGAGLVTLLAALMGMDATGIEIEEALIDTANDFSKKFTIPASFIHGSYYTKDNPTPLLNYKTVDLFFVYPWPNQIERAISQFEQTAASGAVLICYHGGRNYRVLRR